MAIDGFHFSIGECEKIIKSMGPLNAVIKPKRLPSKAVVSFFVISARRAGIQNPTSKPPENAARRFLHCVPTVRFTE
jgi:hypothetical protein